MLGCTQGEDGNVNDVSEQVCFANRAGRSWVRLEMLSPVFANTINFFCTKIPRLRSGVTEKVK
jgi:hypothetical protein